MIRFIFQIFLVVFFSYLTHQYILPWWGIAVGASLATIILYNKKIYSFFAGFIGVGAFWFYLAQQLDNINQSLLSGKVAMMLGLKSSFQLILITALIGAIIGGFSGLTGSLFVSIFKKKKKHNSTYH